MRTLLCLTLPFMVSCYLTSVAFRAVSPILKQSEMAVILAGQRSISCVLKESIKLRKDKGSAAATEFLNDIPELYKWQNEHLRSILLSSSHKIQQMVVLRAHMDTMVYELPCLRDVDVIEVADKTLIQVKEQLIQQQGSHIPLLAKSVRRISETHDIDWTTPTVVVMPEHYEPIPSELCKGSAVICSARNIIDVSRFNRVAVRRRGKKTIQVAASEYMVSG